MTSRGTGNRQKKIVAPRGSRGGERPLHPTAPRPAPMAKGPKEEGPRREDGPARKRE
jgi:hypothetical protein